MISTQYVPLNLRGDPDLPAVLVKSDFFLLIFVFWSQFACLKHYIKTNRCLIIALIQSLSIEL